MEMPGAWFIDAFIRGSFGSLVAVAVGLVAVQWTERPRVEHRYAEMNPITAATEERSETVVLTPAGLPLFDPDRVGDRARALTLSVGAFMAFGFVLALSLRPVAAPWMRPVGIAVLTAQGFVQTAALLSAVYFAEVLYQGTVLYILPCAVACWLISICLFALGLPVARENQRIDADEAGANRVAGIFVSREQASRFLVSTEAVLAERGKHWHFKGCLIQASFEPAVLSTHVTIGSELHEGPLLLVPALILPVVSQQEWFAWVPLVLPTLSDAQLSAQRHQNRLAAQRGWWWLLWRELHAGGWGSLFLRPFAHAVRAQVELSPNESLGPGVNVAPEQLSLAAMHAFTKSAFLYEEGLYEEGSTLPMPETTFLTEAFAQHVRTRPTRWQAWFAQTKSPVAAGLLQRADMEQLIETESFDFTPSPSAADMFDDWPTIDRELSQSLRPEI